jgi:hypothetical protein
MARMNLVAAYMQLGAPRLLISVTNDSSIPVEGLTEGHFTFEKVASPSGIGGADPINASVATVSRPGVYWFTLPLESGTYTIAITMKGYKGLMTVRGQTLLRFTIT